MAITEYITFLTQSEERDYKSTLLPGENCNACKLKRASLLESTTTMRSAVEKYFNLLTGKKNGLTVGLG